MSIQRLILQNFVIVTALDLELSDGFTALTGETGAGKSILLDAIQLLLGARANTDLIQEGAAKTEVAAEFDSNPNIRHWLEQAGCLSDDDLLIKRQIDRNGKSKAWINGSAVSVQQLRQLAPLLINIHGQHAWQDLLQPASMRELLDNFAKVDLTPLKQSWQAWQQSQQQLQQLQQQQQNAHNEVERLQWQIAEVEKLSPQADEWDELQQEHSRLTNAQDLLETCAAALDSIDGDESQGSSASRQLSRAIRLLQEQQDKAHEFAELALILEQSDQLLQEVSHSLNAFLTNNEPDPQRLQQLDQRVTLWLSLSRRFQRQPDQLFSTLQQWQQQLQQLEASADLTALEQQCEQHKQQWQQQAQKVSKLRHAAQPEFSRKISALMQQLGMVGGQFIVQLLPLEQPQPAGLESVQFLIAGHAGSSPKPIHKIASGGELSRIALAISVTSSQDSGADCLIFDEVDSGIGGKVATQVGRLMRQLGQQRQVLCVTHLAQVASFAHQQLLVSKTSQPPASSSQVTALSDPQQRIKEIARMLGGDVKSSVTLAHAQQMLELPLQHNVINS